MEVVLDYWINFRGISIFLNTACNTVIYSYINPLQEFWENLIQGSDLIGPTRWPEGLYDLPPRIGAIHDLDKFDSVFFNISDEEVKMTK